MGPERGLLRTDGAAAAGLRTPRRLAPSGVDLSLVIPVHDEADTVLPLLGEIRMALEGVAEYEIVVVDDASADATLDRLRSAMDDDSRLVVIRHRTRCGQSAALHTGVRAARGAWIATLDGDGQNDPADIPRLLAMARSAGGPAMVAGHRRVRRDGWRKRLGSRLANVVRRTMLGDGTPDSGCGLKVFARDVYLALPCFDHMHRFLPALFQARGARVVIAEVNHRPRLAGVSKYGTLERGWAGLIDLAGVYWLQRRTVRADGEALT